MSAPEPRPDPGPSPSQCDAAVIDVGSNSVRLVLYRLDGRAIWSVFNEKVLAGLGRDLARTGRLSPDGVEATLLALTRFRALIESSRPAIVVAAATAAVREAADGETFRLRVARETGFQLRVLSGEEEARFAALGVLAGAPESEGLVGDLGGASLELVRLGPDGPGQGITLPLGPFAMGGESRFDPQAARATIRRCIEGIELDHKAATLNAVGGAWRNLGLLHMRMSGYPLSIIHQYRIGRGDVLDLTRSIGLQSRSSLERLAGFSRRRLESLPHAAVVLETLVEKLEIQTVVMSAYGLREGLIWEAMSPEVRSGDPLVAGCAALGSRHPVAEALGRALESWVAPGMAKLDPVFGRRDRALVAAACRLAELGSQLHPDHRAELVFHQVLRAPIAGMDHAERAFLACAAFSRHTSAAQFPEGETVARLLAPERLKRARALGAALRLACDMSGRGPDLLARTRLDIKPGSLVLQAEEAWSAILLGEQTAKRAQTLATLLERTLKIRPSLSKIRTFSPAD
jgi:exopolyphosphatase/guanosine-5'-triphosphate,3'-diphosphate pyrophosphatase